MNALLAWARSPTATKIISFCLIGVANAGVDFGVFSLAYQALNVPIILANVIAWLVAVTCSYVMNTMITFREESGRVLRRRDYLKFVASGFVGMVANTLTLLLLSRFMPVYAAKMGAIFMSFIVNFAMSHFIVFRAAKVSKIPGPER
ncbi:MAG: GtrA family protein [Hyphomicrobiales bacterium]|nr:GtrA family protein [Hyphomicrobiales bacterium]